MSTATLNWPDGASVCKNGKFYTLDGKPVGSVAMDAASTNGNTVPNSFNDLDEATKAKIRRVRAKMALDADADRKVKALFPALALSVAMDDADAEQEAQGSFSSEEDDNELERGEVTGNDSTSFEDALVTSTKASADYWKRVNAKNAERNKRYGNNAGYEHSKKTLGSKATDAVSRNAEASRSFSLFDNAATIIRKLKRA